MTIHTPFDKNTLALRMMLFIFCVNFHCGAQELFIDHNNLSDGLKGYFSFDQNTCEYGEGENSVGTVVGNAFISNTGKYSSGGLNFSPQQNQSAYMVFENENSSSFRLENESEMSLLFWVKPAKADDTTQKIITVENGGENYYFEITSQNEFNGYISTASPDSSGDFGNAFSKARNSKLKNDNIDTWYHIAFTYDGYYAKIYIDGELNWTETVTKQNYLIVPWQDRFLYLGNKSDGNQQFKGVLDELYLYSRSLDLSEIQQIKNLDKPLDEYYETFSINFDSNNGSDPIALEASPSNDYSVEIPIVERIGFNFISWNTNEDGSGETLDISTGNLENISNNQTFYAQWTPIVYQITYHLDSAINSQNNPLSFIVTDLPLKIEPPTLPDHRFLHWFKNQTLDSRLSNNSIETLGDISLWPSWKLIDPNEPDYTDYCQMLTRDINGEQYGFLAGNKMYYVAGAGQARYENITELETIGFTHPMFRDGRARGNGILNGAGGTGHDQWGWEFWRRTKSAYGTVFVNGEKFKHPTPISLEWRPDKMVAKYEIGNTTITEEKFISENDVLTTIITSNKDIIIEFEGESFWDSRLIPQFDGDIETTVSQSCTSTINFDQQSNAVVLLENGTAMTKPTWGQPALVGDMMYSGLNFVFSSNESIQDFEHSTLDEGNIGYSFSIDIPAFEAVALTLSVDDDRETALNRITADLTDINYVRDEKTIMINNLLNEEIPYFRCSDSDVVETYYFLWSLYFMYFTNLNEGWESYPHTQTAVNNFMGLHLWDSWAFCGAGSYVANQWDWSFGNALSWKHMVQFKNENNFLPDNFGTHWYSPTTRMNFDGAVGQIWKQYIHSGDLQFLQTAYHELLRPLYIDNDSKAVGVNESQELKMMASELGENSDVTYWESIENREVDRFLNNKWPWLLSQYDNDSWKNNWHVAELRNNALTPEMTSDFIDNYVLSTERGFISPNGINTRSADSPPNGIFRASSISCWLGVDGVFKQGKDLGGIAITLNNYDAMYRDYGYPVAPEAWDENNKAWGSRYYNWDIAMVLPIIEWIGGTNYSIIDETFTYAPHLPDSWDFVEMKVPVVITDITNWVHTKLERTDVNNHVELQHSVKNNPLQNTKIFPYNDKRTIIEKTSSANENTDENGELFFMDSNGQVDVLLKVGDRYENGKTSVWTLPRIRKFAGVVDISVQNLIDGTTLRYTTDGTVPNENSPIASNMISINQTTNFTFKAFGFNTNYDPYSITYEKVPFLPDENVNESTFNGLKYKVFNLDPSINSLPNFSDLSLDSQGQIASSKIVNNLDFSEVGKLDDEHFALHFSGFIKMPEDKTYVFKLRSNDGSLLKIDGYEVVVLDGISDKDPWIAEGSISLEAGFHYIDIFYTQYETRQFLSLEYKELGDTSYQKVTAEMFQSIISHCISFDEQGGSEVEDICKSPGDNIVPPENPTKVGFNFLGWYTDINLSNPFNFPSSMPSEDIRLYAKWDSSLNFPTIDSKRKIEVYPNPNDGQEIQLFFSDSYIGENINFKLFDITNLIIQSNNFTVKSNNKCIELADLNHGLYFIEIQLESKKSLNQNQIFKLIINH